MSASINDKIIQSENGGAPEPTTVSSARSISGSSLSCVALTNWPTDTAVHLITYKKKTDGSIDRDTLCLWKGVVSGTTVGTLTLKGGEDAGNDVGDFVEMAPTSALWQDLYDGLTQTLNNDGTLKTSIVTSSKIADKAVGADALADGALVQTVSTETSTPSAGTTQIPSDSSIPQNTEGDQYMSLAITPKSSTNILDIEVAAWLTTGVASRFIAGALFQDSTADALTANDIFQASSGGSVQLILKHRMVAGTTSTTTFKFRAGLEGTGTLTFGGVSSKFGAAGTSSIVIREYKAS